MQVSVGPTGHCASGANRLLETTTTGILPSLEVTGFLDVTGANKIRASNRSLGPACQPGDPKLTPHRSPHQ
eukprot:scaffold5897_cov37-Phaeocystis_antarctica.AAC.1